MSYAPTIASNQRDVFENHFQMYPSHDDNFVLAFVAVIRHYGWERVSIITEKEPEFMEVRLNACMQFIVSCTHPYQYSMYTQTHIMQLYPLKAAIIISLK